MLIPKTQYIRDEKHRRFIATLPCVVCFAYPCEAAHIRIGNGAGMGLKSGDDCTVPLCPPHHRLQHATGEGVFWDTYGGIEKATKLAHEIYAATGEEMKAKQAIGRFYK